MLLLGFTVAAQTKPTDILGVWLSENKDGKVEIYQTGKRFYGKLIWGSRMFEADGKTSKKDTNNPDKKLAQRPLKDMIILQDFVFEDGQWQDGKIYDPDNGKTYSCKMKLEDGNLNIRGYIGISLIGRTTVWTRTDK